LKKQRYINPKIEEELVEFKKEIHEKFEASYMNKNYRFPRKIKSPASSNYVAPSAFGVSP
jgi:hypothetical protein